ncbi:uncharacterized protein MELLADRAFT_95416 [Melampsora larici-populina 98AG31]|uniref:Uncharacterized protein n=1 Tax=Melampsora larici-populina (strain 98AG31 / pathotype 3-4-7) TaxID=747676 RepID=F4S985_MELLP|nr:uncharacterized protein MELLADRAFT_95416 [Melampsora larici-populina 98AG31]EGF98809.1 hypothetical protein MELLADRAFT_95416 [Melampsora larici-populina 98AG31]
MPSQISITARAHNQPATSLTPRQRSASPRPHQGGSFPIFTNASPTTFTMHAYKKNPLTSAQDRSGDSTGYSHFKLNDVKVEFELKNVEISELKVAIGVYAEKKYPGCKALFEEAESEGKMNYNGYILGSREFGKTRPKSINDVEIYNEFKRVMARNVGKEIGLWAKIQDPKASKKNKQQINDQHFARSMHADNPEANPDDRRRDILNDLNAPPDRTLVYDALFGAYGNNRDGNREGMTFYHPEKPTLVIKMTHIMFKWWTDDIMEGKPNVNQTTPPSAKDRPDFKYVSKNGPLAVLPQAPEVLPTPGLIPPPRPISPAPEPSASFQRFLNFASISLDDVQTRNAIHHIGILEFDEFLYEENNVDSLVKYGMKHGRAARLIHQAAVYRDDIEQRRADI